MHKNQNVLIINAYISVKESPNDSEFAFQTEKLTLTARATFDAILVKASIHKQ